MIFTINTYDGYHHEGDSKLLDAQATLEQACVLEHAGLVGFVPHAGETQTKPFTDVDRDRSREGFVAEITQAGVLVDPEAGKATVTACTIDLAQQYDSGEIYFSSSDELRSSEEVTLDPEGASDEAKTEATDSEEPSRTFATIAGIAMPATKRLLVVQMAPDQQQGDWEAFHEIIGKEIQGVQRSIHRHKVALGGLRKIRRQRGRLTEDEASRIQDHSAARRRLHGRNHELLRVLDGTSLAAYMRSVYPSRSQ